MAFKRISDLGDLTGKTAVVRVDLNVPMADGKVTDDTRLQAVKPTVDAIAAQGGRSVLLAHFGRPKGQVVPEMSLKPVVPALASVLGRSVGFAELGDDLPADEVVVMENTRFFPGEEKNDPELAAKFAALGDVYVNDAFSAAHRAHASTEAVAKLLPSAAGETMGAELEALEAALGKPERPVVAVVGGAKVSSKLAVLENLVAKVDHLIIGGGMANTFLFAQGHDIGSSLCEKDLKDTALKILANADKAGCKVHLPTDVVVAREFKAHADNEVKPADAVVEGEMILDAGPATVEMLAGVLAESKTLVWNGPMGAFEMAPFDMATVALAKAAGKLTDEGKLLTVAGGGDTVAALAHAGVKESFTHISTAGGAFLEWMEGKDLPGVVALG
ncbi:MULTISPECIES: phosphoglycerate kinase [Kordiimonas]|jgi:phosphoglycerate kinase|uniref:Phosphoglycerate kinase n=1 Tax=Kordiimonas lacus TaxID=637679 RepID=A0A1G6ZY84_9PROT|nr:MULTISPECIES: phosphoglycerate kinase [Kordiimonas]SDE07644.1 phosphoglycerate kinase [Kordiimonas lacus]